MDSSSARTAMKKSLDPALNCCSPAPSVRRVSRFAGVAIAALAHRTPGTARIARTAPSCSTEST
jgi:hypothetical protein